MKRMLISFLLLAGSLFPVGVFVPDGSGNVLVIDSTTLNTLANLSVGANATTIIASPNGQKIYVINVTAQAVYVIDPVALSVVTSINVGNNPQGLAITSNGAKLFVSNSTDGTVSIIDTSNNTVLNTPSVGSAPNKMAVSTDNAYLFVCNFSDATVSVVDTSTYLTIDSVSVDTNPSAIVTNGPQVFVANRGSGTVTAFDASTFAPLNTIAVGSEPTFLALNPAGTLLYVSRGGIDRITVVDTTSHLTETISGLGTPSTYLVVSADGTKLYATCVGGTVQVIDTSSNLVTGTINIPAEPLWMGLIAAENKAFVVAQDSPGFLIPIDLVNETAGTPINAGAYPFNAAFANLVAASVSPPNSFVGEVLKDRFLTQIDRVHALSWTASSDPSVVGYLLYRNGVLIGDFPSSGPFSYQDHRASSKVIDTYTLYAYIEDETRSAPLTVLLR